jgi:hypothetical protein
MRAPLLACLVVSLATVGVSCGGGNESRSPTAPTPTPTPTPSPTPTPTPPPPPSRVSLTGTVTVRDTMVRLNGATVRILDGLNAGRVATTANGGQFRFDDLQPSNGNVSATGGTGWAEQILGTYIDGTNTLNFTIRTTNPWSRTGNGNTVFDMPAWVSRTQIRGTWNGTSTSNFIAHLNSRSLINEVLRDRPNRTYEGTHLTTGGGTVEIVNSSNISWTFTEVR